MRVAVQSQAADFEAAARPFLLGDEANHTFLLNRLARGDRDPERGPWWSATVSDGGHLVASAARDRQALFVSNGPGSAWKLLAEALRECAWLEHVIGPDNAAHGVVNAIPRPWRLHVDLPLLQLTGPPDAGNDPPAGRFELARAADDPVREAWSLAFHDEAGLPDPRCNVVPQARRRREAGELFLWRGANDEPTCLAGGFLVPPGGARIAPVYTPPALRGRGYARAAVAALSSHLQSRGARSVVLFTDATNPTANALYRRIGFVPCGRHLHLTLETRT
jgi:ribosomal protein S18 acetylase RimI-like enzyme